MAFATLSIDLVAKLAQFEADLGKAARITEANSQRMAGALNAVKASLGGLVAGFSVGLVIDSFKGITQSIDKLNDLKDATGASIENISALEDVAKRTGTSFEAVGGALVKLNKSLKDGDAGSATAEALKAIGLNAEDLKKIDPAEALLKVAIALKGFADDGNKARLVQELFGKSIREVAPLLNDLAAKGELVATVTTKQAEEAERFNQQLAALAKNSEDFRREIVGGMLPALNQMLEAFTKIKASGNTGTVLKDAFKDIAGLGDLSANPGDDINKLIEKRTKLQADYNTTLAYEVKFKGQLRDGSGAIKADLEQVNKLLEVSRIRQLAAVNPTGADAPDALSRRLAKPPSVKFSGALKPPGKAAPNADGQFATIEADINARISANFALIESGKKLTEAQQFLLATVSKLGNAESKLTDLQKIAITADLERFAGSAKLAEAFEKQLKLEEELGQIRNKTSDINNRAIDALNADLNKLAEVNEQRRISIEELGLEEKAVDRLRIARLEQVIAQEKIALIGAQNIENNDIEIQQLERKLNLLAQEKGLAETEASKKIGVTEEQANKKRSESLSQSLADGLLNGFRQGEGLAEVFLTELKAQFGKTVLQPVIDPIVKFGSDFISSGLKALLGSLGLPSFAVGTDYVPRDMIAQIHKGERIVPAAQNRGGSGQAVTVMQNFTVGDVASISMVRQAVSNSERRIAAGISRNLQYGGALS